MAIIYALTLHWLTPPTGSSVSGLSLGLSLWPSLSLTHQGPWTTVHHESTRPQAGPRHPSLLFLWLKAAHLPFLPQRYLTLSFSTPEVLFFTLPCLPEGLKGVTHPGLLWDLRCLKPALFIWQSPVALWHSWRAWTGLVFLCVLPLHILLIRHWVYNNMF